MCILTERPELCSGFGQYHSESTSPLVPIKWAEIQHMVDAPPTIDKSESRWWIPSSAMTRKKANAKEADGDYWALWADIDHFPPTLEQLAAVANMITRGGCFETYTSKSATLHNQKARILIPLAKPLRWNDWQLCQEVLNDKLQEANVTPDRANEGIVQLCFLPNCGEYFQSISVRSSHRANALSLFNGAVQKKIRAKNEAQQLDRQRFIELEAKRLKMLQSGSQSLIQAFNTAFTVEEILVRGGYEQRGNSFRHPNSQSGSFSAGIKDERVFSLSSSDPLHTGSGGGSHDAFSVYCVLFHNDDTQSALTEFGKWRSGQ